jgi:hypothetical protein
MASALFAASALSAATIGFSTLYGTFDHTCRVDNATSARTVPSHANDAANEDDEKSMTKAHASAVRIVFTETSYLLISVPFGRTLEASKFAPHSIQCLRKSA